jgi:uncharacterized protein YrrD
LETGGALGRISGLVTDPSGKRILAFVLRMPTLFAAAQIISPIDIIEYAPQVVIVRSREALLKPEEIAQVKDLLKRKINPLNKPVITPKGKRLGVVADLVIEEGGAQIIKYYLKPGLLSFFAAYDLILPAENVLKVDSRSVLAQEENAKEITEQTGASVTSPVPPLRQ